MLYKRVNKIQINNNQFVKLMILIVKVYYNLNQYKKINQYVHKNRNRNRNHHNMDLNNKIINLYK